MKYSIFRRQTKLLDLVTDFKGAHGYKVQYAKNFDQPFTDIITSGRYGFRDPNVHPAVLGRVSGPRVRIAFDPTSYSIDDDKPFWIKLVEIDSGGNPVDTSPPRMILPPFSYVGITVIRGTAPNGATVDESLTLQLAGSFAGLRIHNESEDTALYVSMGDDAETMVAFGTDRTLANLNEAQSVIKVRGDGKDVMFSITMSPVSET